MFDVLKEFFMQLSWRSFVDIACVAAIFYQVIATLKGTRAVQVMSGMIFIVLTYVLSHYLGLETLQWLINKFYSSLIVVVVVLFQDDIKRILTRVGKSPFINFSYNSNERTQFERTLDEIFSAAQRLHREKTGALIVFERQNSLQIYAEKAIPIDSVVHEFLLEAIFQPFSKLHDGAVIISRNNRIICASAQLPNSKNMDVQRKKGMRHNAAVGITEECDAVVLVISEETGNVSVAEDGQLHTFTSVEPAKAEITKHLVLHSREEKSRKKGTLERFVYTPFNIISLLPRFLVGVLFKRRSAAGTVSPPGGIERRQGGGRRTDPAPQPKGESPAAQMGASLRLPGMKRTRLPPASGQHSQVPPLASGLVLGSGTAAVFDSILHASSRDVPTHMDMDLESGEVLDDMAGSAEDMAFAKNEAAVALHDIRDEDRLETPEVPMLPPQDISIGGVPLSPDAKRKE